VQVVATVESDWSEPVRIEVPPSVLVDDSTPAASTLPPIRKTLERLLALYRQPRSDPGDPWELTVAPDLGRQQSADDLQAYLAAGIPPQAIRWLIRPPEDAGGKFPVAVTAGGHAPVRLSVVLGDDFPPAARSVRGAADWPIKEVRLVYPQPKLEPVFWQPLACLEGAASIPFSARLAAINVGWLTLYILVYVPVLLVVRPLWKVA
jgi:hypothetical protein